MNITLELQKLDELIIEHTNPPATTILRNQLHPLREQLEAYVETKEQEAKDASELEARHQQLLVEKEALVQRYAQADEAKHKVGVTLNNGVTRIYDANTYALLPNKNAPQTIEFRMLDKVKHTYREVAHAKWSEVAEVHEPAV